MVLDLVGSEKMALFRKFFYRKPPDGLLEISERVYGMFDFNLLVFDLISLLYGCEMWFCGFFPCKFSVFLW